MSLFVIIGGGVLFSVVVGVILCRYNLTRLLKPTPAPTPSIEAIAVLRSVAQALALTHFQLKWLSPTFLMVNGATTTTNGNAGEIANHSVADPVACISIGGAAGNLLKVSTFTKGSPIPASTMQATVDSDQHLDSVITTILEFLDPALNR